MTRVIIAQHQNPGGAMVARRDVVGRGLLAGLAALVLPKPAAAAGQDRGDQQQVVQAIDRLRGEMVKAQECTLGPCDVVSTIRMQQNVFLRANQKFPEFIDAGVEAWQAVYDWHVKHRQPIATTRLPDGRYGIAFMFTTIVLRYENTSNFIGLGYDAR
jgi:hypothetical protein